MSIFLDPFRAIFYLGHLQNDSEGFTNPYFNFKWNLNMMHKWLAGLGHTRTRDVTTHQSRNPHLAQSAERTRCIRTSYTGGIKGQRHKGQWSTVSSIETLESSIVGSCSVCMISPTSCTTISRLGLGYYKALPSHILYYFKVH